MDPAELKKNFTEQIEKTDAQIRELEQNLEKAKEYKTKLTGGLVTIELLNPESKDEAPAVSPESTGDAPS